MLSSDVPLKVVASCLDTLQPVILEDFADAQDLETCLRASANVPEVSVHHIKSAKTLHSFLHAAQKGRMEDTSFLRHNVEFVVGRLRRLEEGIVNVCGDNRVHHGSCRDMHVARYNV